MRFKPDIDRVRWRMEAFWAHEMADRALLSVIAPRTPGAHTSMFHNPEDPGTDMEALRRYWEDAETIRRNALRRLEGTYLGGETLPVIFQNYGTDGHCQYFGAKPVYSRDTIWFDPSWESLEDAEGAYDDAPLQRHLDIARYLTDHAGDDYLVGMPDHCGTLDALGHLYGSENLLLDMLAEPALVQAAATRLDAVWTQANEQFYQTSRTLNGGGVHAWMHLWAPGRLQQMQCDLSVMISPAMFEAFMLPELHRQMAWIEYPVYHFDGAEQARHLDMLLSLERLRAIQWTHVAGQPSASHFLPILRRVQAAGKSLVVMAPPGDVAPLLDGLSAKGLYIHTEADTPEEAERLVAYAARHSKP